VSDAVRDRLVQSYGFPEARTITIRNGVDLRYFARPEGLSIVKAKQDVGFKSTNRILLCISNLNRQKRLDVLLDACSLVVPSHPETFCVILGRGELESELRKQAVQLGLEGRVKFRGHVRDVRPFLAAADVFTLSSDNEWLPLSLGEAMAYGVPSVVTDAGGNREIVVHGETGYLVERGSPHELAKEIDFLLSHKEERTRMGINAQKRVQQYFDMEKSMRVLHRELTSQA
jgi:glycosyltransferase involved in cell wall biosynthesis